MKLLLDENMSTSLVEVGRNCGHDTCHLVYRGKAGIKDHQVVALALSEDRVIVTRNAQDFRGRVAPGGLLQQEVVHAGLICINLPHASPLEQQEALAAVLDYIHTNVSDMVNIVVELWSAGNDYRIEHYAMPT